MRATIVFTFVFVFFFDFSSLLIILILVVGFAAFVCLFFFFRLFFILNVKWNSLGFFFMICLLGWFWFCIPSRWPYYYYLLSLCVLQSRDLHLSIFTLESKKKMMRIQLINFLLRTKSIRNKTKKSEKTREKTKSADKRDKNKCY